VIPKAWKFYLQGLTKLLSKAAKTAFVNHVVKWHLARDKGSVNRLGQLGDISWPGGPQLI